MDGLEWDSDPTAYVLSANVHRRHLTSSQKAMAYAMMYPDGRQGQRTDLLKNINKSEIDKATISRARFILKHAPEIAKLARDGHPNYPLSSNR